MAPKRQRLSVPGWARLWAALQATCTPRGYRTNIIRADPAGRRPWEILEQIRRGGHEVDAELVSQLSAEHAFPSDISARKIDLVLSHYAFDCGKNYRIPQWRRRGWGGVSSGDKPGKSDKVVFQFGGRIDCGFRNDLDDALDALEALDETGDLAGVGEVRLSVLRRFLRWLRNEEKRLKRKKMMKPTVAHLAVYRKGGVMNVHLDIRLDSPLSRRALYPIQPRDGSDVNEDRLTFFLGFQKNGVDTFGAEPAPWPTLEPETALCIGNAGGPLLLKGGGAGGFWLIPPGVLWDDDARGRGLYAWHEPHHHIEGDDGPDATRATMAISGKAFEAPLPEDESSARVLAQDLAALRAQYQREQAAAAPQFPGTLAGPASER